MTTTASLESLDAGFGLAAPLAADAASSVPPVAPVSRAASLQALIDQVGQLTARLADAGSGQFQLEWGGSGRDQVRVEVALRDGRWQVEFRSPNPELTRFLDREWSQTAEARQISSHREAEVAFTFEDSAEHRGREEAPVLSSAETALLRQVRQSRFARNHS